MIVMFSACKRTISVFLVKKTTSIYIGLYKLYIVVFP